MFEKVVGYDKGDGDIAEVAQALSVLGNKAAPSEEKKKSFEFIKSYGVGTSTILANKLSPNAWKRKPQFSVDRFGTTVLRGGVKYNEDEKEDFRKKWMHINSFLETFTNLQTLETGVASFLDTTVRFDPTIFAGRTRITRLLTTAELEQAEGITNNADMPTSIKSKAKLIGVDDLVKFVKDQREFAQRLQVIK